MIKHPIQPLLEILYNLPYDISAPEVFLQGDGSLGLDWQVAANIVLSCSVNENGRIGWSALILDHSEFGHWLLSEGPSAEFKAIVELYAKAVRDAV